MLTKFITPCPVYPDGGAHACGPITWGPAERRATFDVFLVQENALARGSLEVDKGVELWELHAHPVEGKMTPGAAVGFGLARVEMASEHEEDSIATFHWSESLTLVKRSH
jgi:hypothetical protein